MDKTKGEERGEQSEESGEEGEESRVPIHPVFSQSYSDQVLLHFPMLLIRLHMAEEFCIF